MARGSLGSRRGVNDVSWLDLPTDEANGTQRLSGVRYVHLWAWSLHELASVQIGEMPIIFSTLSMMAKNTDQSLIVMGPSSFCLYSFYERSHLFNDHMLYLVLCSPMKGYLNDESYLDKNHSADVTQA